jgi:hypothetical protein
VFFRAFRGKALNPDGILHGTVRRSPMHKSPFDPIRSCPTERIRARLSRVADLLKKETQRLL